MLPWDSVATTRSLDRWRRQVGAEITQQRTAP
jgi:hypothetical protein